MMPLVPRCADHGFAAGSRAALAGVSLCTGIVIRAGRAIGLGWIRADAGGLIAGARVMALVGRRAGDRTPLAETQAVARVLGRTRVTVVAGGARVGGVRAEVLVR